MGEPIEEMDSESLRRQVINGNWQKVVEIFEQNPEAQDTKITMSGDTALHIAVSEGNVDVVQQLVELIPDENVNRVLRAENERGNTPLHIAVSEGKVDVVQQLVGLIPRHNVYEVLHAKNERGNTPLHLAAALGTVAMCYCIAKRYPNLIITRNHDGETALHIALSDAKVDLVRQLVGLIPPENTYGVLSAGNKRGNTLLHLAVELGMDDMCSCIVERDPKLIGTRNHDGETALHIALSDAKVDLVWQLVGLIPPKNTYEVLSAGNKRGNTLLHLAVELGMDDMCSCIVERDPKLIGTRNHDHETALHIALSDAKVDLVRQLVVLIPPDNVYEVLSAGNRRGNTLLHLAVALGMDAMCSYIVKRDPKLIGTRNRDGETVLHIALSDAKVDLVQQLVGLIPPDNVHEVLSAGNKRGNTLLHLAVALGMDDMCSYIAQRDPELIGTCNHDGETALHIAVSDAKVDLVRQLVGLLPPNNEYKALSTKDERGNTPLHLAAALGTVAMCKCIPEKYPQLIGARNHDDETPLFLAVLNGKTKAFLCLHEQSPKYCIAGCSYCTRLSDGDTILHCAIFGDYFGLAYHIINLYEGLVDWKNNKGQTALHVLATKPSAFKSGSRLGIYDQIIYRSKNPRTGVFVDPLAEETLSKEDYEDDSEDKRSSKYPDNYRTCENFFWLLMMIIKLTVFKLIVNLFLLPMNTIKVLVRGGKNNGNPPDVENPNKVSRDGSQGPYPTSAQLHEGESSNATQIRSCKPAKDPNLKPQRSGLVPPNYETLLFFFKLVMKGLLNIVLGLGSIRAQKIQDKKEKHEWAIRVMDQMLEKTSVWEKEENETGKRETPLLLAAKYGVIEMVEKILNMFPLAIRDSDLDEKNVVLLAVENRQPHVYMLLQDRFLKESVFRKLDNQGNSALHLAATLGKHKPWRTPGAALQMQWEVKWYKFVKYSMPRHYFVRYNTKGLTPKEVFNETHKDLVKEGVQWLNNTSQSCSLMAALIATVAFTSSSTVPGGVKEEYGTPTLEGQPAFSLFAITSLLALCFSVTSLIMFLATLTSRYRAKDFASDLPNKFMIGLGCLFISIVAMMITFCSGHFFVVKDNLKYAAYPLYAAACLPVLFSSRFAFFFGLIKSTFSKFPQPTSR